MTDPILAVRDLTVAFRSDGRWREVVHGVSFDVAPRETVALVGESGSGKSVSALSVLRLLPRDASRIGGSVRFAGRELLTAPEAEMRRVRGDSIAMIFQEPMTSLNPVLTIGFQIAEALIRHRGLSRAAAEAEALRLLDTVRIPAARARLHEYPHRFSGGMRQRVMIAMALACRPKLLIADEPTTALDVTIQAQILDLIKSLQDETGMSVLFITHDMGVVAEIADRTVVMLRGRAVETGPTARIFSEPAEPYTRALLAAVPRLGAMAGRTRPMRFPVIDRATGMAAAPPDAPDAPDASPEPLPDTVTAAERPLLEVRDLTTRFEIRSGLFGRVTGRVHAVERVSFSLGAGETLALVGESGCGKSTTGRSILRLVEPLSGSVVLDGEDITGLDAGALRTRRRRMQMIFQDPFASLDPRMSVGAAVAEPLLINRLASRAEALRRAADLLARVGLSPDMATRFPHEFSGGQRQRVAIARALALNPRLIVADEAVSALDVSVKAQVVNLMLDLQAELGLAYLFISHDMAVVERVSHRVAVMYLGEIVEIGPRDAVFGNPQHPYTRKLLAAVPVPDPARRRARHALPDDEIRSPIRPPDYEPPERLYREVSPGHSVQAWDATWDATWDVTGDATGAEPGVAAA
ncbi:ABC transporter ATP-binding protein [Methylobacterium sp. SI9]|uniref:ABC transporter ATP-binding protein n=1 Tax=Methylobacterium guangdongense TaxID=3138811 RepID=UPI00313AE2B0